MFACINLYQLFTKLIWRLGIHITISLSSDRKYVILMGFSVKCILSYYVNEWFLTADDEAPKKAITGALQNLSTIKVSCRAYRLKTCYHFCGHVDQMTGRSPTSRPRTSLPFRADISVRDTLANDSSARPRTTRLICGYLSWGHIGRSKRTGRPRTFRSRTFRLL